MANYAEKTNFANNKEPFQTSDIVLREHLATLRSSCDLFVANCMMISDVSISKK